MLHLSRIETAGPDKKARRLSFSDGTMRLTAARALKAVDVEEGASVELREFEEALTAAETATARERAIQLLGYRDRTYEELRRRLSDDGYPFEVAVTTADWLRDIALLDDERFAHTYVRMRGAAGYGRSRIARELGQRGIDAETVRTALEESDLPSDSERAKEALRGVVPQDRKTRDRYLRKLITRGYSFGDALDALDSAQSADSE